MTRAMEPAIPQLKPCLITLKAGRTYLWCSCGRSKRQPFCDGSHQGTGFEPLKYLATTDGEEVLFCGCKHTRTPPFCDGTHNNLPGGAPLDDAQSPANLAVQLVPQDAGVSTALNGSCYIFSPQRAQMSQRGSLRYCTTISGELGALYQTQFFMQVKGEPSPAMSFGDRDVILFVSSGRGRVDICGREFDVKATDGVYVRPSEGLRLIPAPGTALEVFVSACPLAEIGWPEAMPDRFDASFPQRIASVDVEQRTAMGPRYFQVLVDKTIGSSVITQFIGHIPQSKAMPHRHLYEESLIILSGEGCVWTEDRKAVIRAGDVLFLPRKQVHSLQALSPEGIDLVGVIYPGDNPSINY